MTEPMTPERLAWVRRMAQGQHPGDVIFAVADVEGLVAEVDRLQAQVANLVDLFTYVPINNSSRRLTALHGDADVTEEVRAALASGDEVPLHQPREC